MAVGVGIATPRRLKDAGKPKADEATQKPEVFGVVDCKDSNLI